MFENTLEELGLEYKVIKPHTPKQNGRVRGKMNSFLYFKMFESIVFMRIIKNQI